MTSRQRSHCDRSPVTPSRLARAGRRSGEGAHSALVYLLEDRAQKPDAQDRLGEHRYSVEVR